MFPSFNARRIWAWDLGIYLALAALAHFSIPLLWQMQWDEWVFLLPALEKDWASLSYQTLGRGLPGEALIYAFLILFKNPVAVSKVLIFINLVFLGAGTAALARSLRVLGPVLCWAAGAFAMLWPAYKLWSFACILHMTACCAFFAWGMSLLNRFLLGESLRTLIVAIALLCAALFFEPNYFPYWAILAFTGMRTRFWRKKPLGMLGLALFPVLHYFSAHVLFPKLGVYTNYNEVSQQAPGWHELLADLPSAIGQFFNEGLVYSLNQAFFWMKGFFPFLPSNRVLSFILLPLFLFLGRLGVRNYRGTKESRPSVRFEMERFLWPYSLAIALTVALILASIPYILIKKVTFHAFAPTSRFNLVQLCAGALLLALVLEAYRQALGRAFAGILTLAFLISFCVDTLRTHETYAYRGLMDAATISYLSQHSEQLRGYSSFVLYRKNQSRRELARWYDGTIYANYEVSGIAKLGFGETRQAWTGASSDSPTPCYQESRYASKGWLFQNKDYVRTRALELSVEPSDKLNHSSLLGILLRWIGASHASDAEKREFLDQAVTLQQREIPFCLPHETWAIKELGT